MIFLCLPVSAQQYKFTEPLHVFEGKKLVKNGLFENPLPRFDELKKLYEQGKFKNYPEFIDFIFKSQPDLASRYVLIHHSESLQIGTPDFPRVILFRGPNAWALSENQSQGSPRLEILESEPGSYRVQLSEVRFHLDKVEFVKNPKSCVLCHGTPAKPIWNPYDFWPNAFGSAIGMFGTDAEEVAYQKLRTRAYESPLLSKLNWPEAINLDSENLSGLTQTITQMSFGRWVAQNLSAKQIPKIYLYPIMAVLSMCTTDQYGGVGQNNFDRLKLREYFRRDENPEVFVTLNQMGQKIKAAREKFKGYLDLRVDETFPGGEKINEVHHDRLEWEINVLAQLFLVLKWAGVETAQLTTSLYYNDFLISSPSHFSFDLLTTLYELRPDAFSEVKWKVDNFSLGTNSFVRLDCESLRKQSLKVFRKNRALKEESKFVFSAREPAIGRCVRCHDGGTKNAATGDLVPRIPFRQPEQLSLRIRNLNDPLKGKILDRIQKKGKGQMPPGQPLTANEIEAFKEFLDTL